MASQENHTVAPTESSASTRLMTATVEFDSGCFITSEKLRNCVEPIQEPSPRADYKKELVKLKKSLAGFYIISCTDDGYVINLQKQLLNPESENERHILLEDVLKDKDLIPNLLIALIERTISIDKGNQYLNRLLGGTKKQREIAETIIKRGYLPPPKQ